MAMSNWNNDNWGGYDPFFDVRHIHNQVDSIFSGFFNDRQLGRQSGPQQRGAWLPLVDVKENDKGISIHAELPGIKREDIHVDVSDGILTLSGEKKDVKKEENEHYHR
jgi:HSP20 family protein